MISKNLNLKTDLKILVTGGAGFIGSNLCEVMVNNGNQVRCLDNLANGKLENINHLKSASDFEFIEVNIRDIKHCIQACEGVDYVLHQATLGSVPHSIKDPLTSNDVNVGGSEYGPEREGDVHHTLASIDKAKKSLDFDPKYDMKSSLQEAVKWNWNNL